MRGVSRRRAKPSRASTAPTKAPSNGGSTAPAGGKPRAFATILRWNVKLEDDERDTTGRVLVVTRLGPGGVCHVGYVDARANPNANELAQQLADEKARGFRCGADKPIVAGKVMPGLSMPKGG